MPHMVERTLFESSPQQAGAPTFLPNVFPLLHPGWNFVGGRADQPPEGVFFPGHKVIFPFSFPCGLRNLKKEVMGGGPRPRRPWSVPPSPLLGVPQVGPLPQGVGANRRLPVFGTWRIFFYPPIFPTLPFSCLVFWCPNPWFESAFPPKEIFKV